MSLQKIVEMVRGTAVSETAKARGFATDSDMRDFSLYESRKTRLKLSQNTVTRLQEKYPMKMAEVAVMDRAGDNMGDGAAFFAITALQVQYDKALELKTEFPTFVDFANHILDKTDEEFKRREQQNPT